MPRYVVLRHELPSGHACALHWDLMFEIEGVLRTWALACEPAFGQSIEAEQLADHRLAYLDYEGDVSGDRGRVTRWDAGTYEIGHCGPGSWQATLAGARLVGRANLARSAHDDHSWRVVFEASPTSG